MSEISTKTFTFHSALNYGAILQTIGLQNELFLLGIDNQVVNYTDKCMNQYDPKNLDNLSMTEKIKKLIKYIIYGKKLSKRHKLLLNFINNNIILTNKVNDIDEIINVINKEDILITGSDQVWSTEIMNGLSDIYTLNFNNGKNQKVSYAASVGNAIIDSKYINDFQKKLKQIDKISVREESLKKGLQKLLCDKKIDVVLDPTLLLTKEQWNKLIESEDTKEELNNEKYIVAYTLDVNPEYIKIVNELSKQTGYKVVYFDYRNYGFKNILKNCYLANPYEFISYIKNAQYVVTTSFHGTVFSLIFNKKLWVIPHRKRGARMIDLLNKVKLNNRIVNSLDEFKNKKYDEEINYLCANDILSKERKYSIDWLISSLGSKEGKR